LALGVAAAIEHERVLLSLPSCTVVDIGANRGQFALAARRCFPDARIISFEPLAEPAKKYRALFSRDSRATLHEVAIAQDKGLATIHISAEDDSSSLLPITPLQTSLFPGTGEVAGVAVRTAPLDTVLTEAGIVRPAMLKVDVQGFELEALQGCVPLLEHFDYVYVECSFVELYGGQALAHEVVAFLAEQGFRLAGIYNMSYDKRGRAIQGDFAFVRADAGSEV
jgi:FkbM family methyltransferase